MSVEQITRELRRQAEDTATWAPPGIGQLRARRARVRRTRGAAVGAAALAVLAAAYVVPRFDAAPGEIGPATPSPSGSATPRPDAASLPWSVVRCAPPALGGCALPVVLAARGAQYSQHRGGSIGSDAVPPGATLRLTEQAGERDRVVLVDVTGAGPGSRVQVRIADAAPVAVPAGRPVLLRLPDRRVRIVLTETGRIRAGELLSIEEYVALPRTAWLTPSPTGSRR